MQEIMEKKLLILEVSKRTGENIIETIQKIKSIVYQKTRNIPNFININFSR